VITFESSTDIRERTGASWGHTLQFNRPYEYVSTRPAEARSQLSKLLRISQVDGVHCGVTHLNDRREESVECLNCEHETHADYDAANNIGMRYLRRNKIGGDGARLAGVRLNSGTLNASGEFEPPAENSDRAGVHAEGPPF